MTIADAALDAHTIKPAEAKRIRSQSRGIIIGVCMAFLLMLGNVALGVALINQQSDYHASSIKKSNIIIAAQVEHAGTLMQIAKLAEDIDNLVALVPATKTALVGGQNQLIGELAALCTATHANCPAVP